MNPIERALAKADAIIEQDRKLDAILNCAACGRAFIGGEPTAHCRRWYHDYDRDN